MATLDLHCWERALFLYRKRGLLCSCEAWISHCGGLSHGPRAPGHVGFGSCGSWALEHRLSSRSAQVHLFRVMWDLPDSGIELMSLALAGRFSTTEPTS